MLSQDVAVEAAGVDAQPLGHHVAEAGGVQVGAAAEDAVLGEAAELPGHVGHDVHCAETKTATLHKAFSETGQICLQCRQELLAPFIKEN